MQESHVFPKDLKRPEYSLDMVRNMAKGLNQMILAQVNATSDDELAKATWESTVEEIEKQWVWRDVTSDISEVILAKRFGLQQKNKNKGHRRLLSWWLQQNLWDKRETPSSCS